MVEPVLSIPLDKLGLSRTIVNLLQSRGAVIVGDLLGPKRPVPGRLLMIGGVGSRSVSAIRKALSCLGASEEIVVSVVDGHLVNGYQVGVHTLGRVWFSTKTKDGWTRLLWTPEQARGIAEDLIEMVEVIEKGRVTP